MIWRFRPLIRGFFFYMLKDIIKTYRDNPGFRPLIRGFFFYIDFRRCSYVQW